MHVIVSCVLPQPRVHILRTPCPDVRTDCAAACARRERRGRGRATRRSAQPYVPRLGRALCVGDLAMRRQATRRPLRMHRSAPRNRRRSQRESLRPQKTSHDREAASALFKIVVKINTPCLQKTNTRRSHIPTCQQKRASNQKCRFKSVTPSWRRATEAHATQETPARRTPAGVTRETTKHKSNPCGKLASNSTARRRRAPQKPNKTIKKCHRLFVFAKGNAEIVTSLPRSRAPLSFDGLRLMTSIIGFKWKDQALSSSTESLCTPVSVGQ